MEPQPIQLKNPDALNAAIDLLAALQGDPRTARPFIGAALDSLYDRDLDGFLESAAWAVTHTITGKQPISEAIQHIHRAFALNQNGERQ